VEHFDVLDAEGRATGVSKPRAEVHRDGDWHRSVHVWILNGKNELLIQRRSLNKDTNPGLWDVSAAGHLSAGEASLEAAVKEVGEELGLRVVENELEFLFTVKQQAQYPSMDVIDNEIQDVYLLTKEVPISALVVQEEEVAGLRFISIEELEQLVAERSPEFVRHDEEYRRLFALLRKRTQTTGSAERS
jgi:isopentenyldiphosphate isomerase